MARKNTPPEYGESDCHSVSIFDDLLVSAPSNSQLNKMVRL